VAAVFAPYDELAKATVVAVQNDNLAGKVKVYGIDISNADIELMTQPDSPWVATSATDPAAVGAGVVRTLALALAGQLKGTSVQFPAVPITQQFLRDQKITNMNQLRSAEPKLDLHQVSSAPWLPAVTH
jgi:simple sugar transport system substrate-binding protein